MDLKQLLQKYTKKVTSIWNTGKIQRSSRVTYDVFWNITLFFIVIGVVGLFFAGGIGAGYFASLVKDEPIRSYSSMEKDIYNYEETSKLYFADGKYFGDVRSDLHREEITLENVSEILLNAVIATEDEYFNEHNGIVPKAIVRAVIQEAVNADFKTGGSTLTQQLIKNRILTNEVSFDRKAKEILLALRLENFFEKDQILEAYLNIIPYGRNSSGRNIAGIQTAAQGIFGVNASEINLAQAAYLAGLPQSPTTYSPFINTGGLKDKEGLKPGINRMKTVLKRMYEAEYINKEEYEAALTYDIVADFIEETESPIDRYPSLTFEVEKRAKDILIEKLANDNGYTMEDLESDEELYEQYNILAKRDLSMNGYEIHSTIDKEIFETFQEVIKNYQYYGPDRKDEKSGEIEQIQTGAMLIENHTGRIISFVGGREFSLENQVNYATNAVRPNGSTMKPLLDYAPAMEKGVVQPGSVIADYPKTIHIPGQKPWSPKNYGGGYYGIVSAREALAKSHNIPAVEIYTKIINDNPAKEYLEKMGITTLTKEDQSIYSLSLGAMSKGVTIEENTNAFATFGNNGEFVDAYMIEKITTNDGEIIYENESEAVDVFSPQTTYLTIDMMRDVIRNGTATYLNSQIKHGGVDWAGKTGTSEDYKDAWFVGTNPNVTFGVWLGYDTPSSIRCQNCSLSYSQRTNKLWAELINSAIDIKPDLVGPKERFKRPEGIVERSYCAISGMLPSDLCKKLGLIKTDIFNAKFVPTKKDDSLIKGSYVIVDNKAIIAGPNTPKEYVEGDGITFNPEFLKRNDYDKLNDLSQLYPRTNRSLWEKIGIPSGDVGDALKDDGKNPAAPSSVKASKNKLSWNRSNSKDVVGYRIYHASDPNGNFKLIGHTTGTEISFSGSGSVFHVKAVDYFGLESKASDEVIVDGTLQSKEKEDKDKDKEKEKENEKEKKNEKDKNKDKDKEKENKQTENENNDDD